MPVSGHAKLKRSLLLRDFLAQDLGLRLKDAERTLEAVESERGASEAFADGAFLDALITTAQRDAVRDALQALDGVVRDSCRKARFGPRYPQYLALLLMAHAQQRLAQDETRLLHEANAYKQVIWHGQALGRTEKAERAVVEDFRAEDFQVFAFWMATGAGKTHVLHACLAMLEDRGLGLGRGFDRVVLITPSESMSRQHASALGAHMANPVFVYPDDGDSTQIAHLSRNTVLVIDINKMTQDKKGDGLRLDTQAFRDARNLVFVDEGHKGGKSEESIWKSIQSELAGIGHRQKRHRGMLIEFSATFGQLADADHAFARYAKSVVYDYPYDRFHADLYGKDFDVRNIQGTAATDNLEDALAASLVAYWFQLHQWHARPVQSLVREHGLEIEKPLWVMLGLTVLGGKKDADMEKYQSDILETLGFIARLLAVESDALQQHLGRLQGVTGQALLPSAVWQGIQQVPNLAVRILGEVFHWQPGAILQVRVLKRSEGELGLGLSHGDRFKFFGVVNVGNAEGLRPELQARGIAVENDVLTPSLFSDLEHAQSDVHVLMGSRRFSEGWNNYRASTLTLLRLGTGQGPLIIQMFGRVVRFHGKDHSGKRLPNPPEALRPLQTAYVFGLRADYMATFLETLHANGIEEKVKLVPTTKMADDKVTRLIHLADKPGNASFLIPLNTDPEWHNKVGLVSYSAGVGIQTLGMRSGNAVAAQAVLDSDVTDQFRSLIGHLNFDAIYHRMLDYRANQRWWRLSFKREQLLAALEHGIYRVEGDTRLVTPTCRADLGRLENVAVHLLQKMMQRAYRQHENEHVQYFTAPLRHDNDMVLEQVFVREAG
jgi:hypothetical protein